MSVALLNTQMHALSDYYKKAYSPSLNLSGSEYADKYFYMSSENSSVPGKFVTRPYQKEILDCMADRECHTVVVKKPTRVGYTIMLSVIVSFFIASAETVLVYHPNGSEAMGFGQDTLTPMIRDNPNIALLMDPEKEEKEKRGKAIRTSVKRTHPGGYVEVLGVESSRNLNRRTARCAIGDEIDSFKKDVDGTGNPLPQIERRTQDYLFRKNIFGGKPVGGAYKKDEVENKNTSAIDKKYQEGDMRQRWLPCPHCQKLLLLKFFDTEHHSGMQWDKEYDSKGKVTKHLTDTAHYVCDHCHQKIENRHKFEMDRKGEWIAQKPFAGIASFHFWAILSPSPNVNFRDIAREFIEAKSDPVSLKTFYNEVLAETFEIEYKKAEIIKNDRLEKYKAQVPDGVLVLSAGVDIGKVYIIYEVVGWGREEESWSIEHKKILGDPNKKEVWQKLREVFEKDYYTEDGGTMKIMSMAVDSKYLSSRVYDFANSLSGDGSGRGVYAIQGSKDLEKLLPNGKRPSFTEKSGTMPFYNIGVNAGKTIINWHMSMKEIGAGYMHFPNDPETYDDKYFKGLASEKLVDGRWTKFYARNEPLDIRNYAYIILKLTGVDLEILYQNQRRILHFPLLKDAAVPPPRRIRTISKGIKR